MKPEQKSNTLLSMTRSKAKMYEYNVPTAFHINLSNDPARLMSLAIGMLGDYAAEISSIPFQQRLEGKSEELKFSAQFFDAYYQSKLGSIDKYLMLLGAASYYLCDLPGSARVLTSYVGEVCPNLEADGLESFVLWILQGRQVIIHYESKHYTSELAVLAATLSTYRQSGQGESALFEAADNLKEAAYKNGTPRQLLFADVSCALIRVMYENSSWRCLPEYSELSSDDWEQSIKKPSFVQELWPAQRLLGKQGVFAGKSAVIQMPTSAGKTKATEIIIRSAFLSKRTELAIVVAPFKALCHEIRDTLSHAFSGEDVSVEEFSEVIQDDVDLFATAVKQQVFVVTPEKLVYVLKQAPEFASGIGLIIYDEGHQFDSGSRGVTFELLLTTLKSIVSQAQTVLISAVLSNASAINEWLHPNGAEVVSGLGLDPNYKSIAFSSWKANRGQLYFVKESDPSSDDFFVPRIIESFEISKTKLFPRKSEPNTVSLFLSLKLVTNGSVALFCGTKLSATAVCRIAVETFRLLATHSKKAPIEVPAFYSNKLEISRLYYQHSQNLGPTANITQAAKIGIYNHHNNVPNGIRLSVEYSIRKDLTKFVICTSTLSQGVNLPIRYLIVSGLHQGGETMKIRDFHNLIGRAGRSGVYTEGSIIFGNPEVYDSRNERKDNWRWRQAVELLGAANSEPCTSYLLTIFEGFYNDKRTHRLQAFDILEFTRRYVDGAPVVTELPIKLSPALLRLGFTPSGIQEQVKSKMAVLGSIESYLMSYATEVDALSEDGVNALATNTLAFHLAEAENKANLLTLFNLLEKNISTKVPTYPRRRAFGKTLYGLQKSIELESWVLDNQNSLDAATTGASFLNELWPVIEQAIDNKLFKNATNRTHLKEFTSAWLMGLPFHSLLTFLESNQVEQPWGKGTRKLMVEQVVDLCQNALSFEGSLAIGAINSILAYHTTNQNATVKAINLFQKRFQYGLPNQASIIFYELGFGDRVVAIELSTLLPEALTRSEAIEAIKSNAEAFEAILEKYPAYFTNVLAEAQA